MNDIKSEGIMIFKDTMEYLTEGILTAEQFAELIKMIYAVRWGDGVDEKEIKDKLLLGIWKTLKHTIKKSARNARHYEKKKVQQEAQNKGTGNTQIVQSDNLYYQEGESAPECPRISEDNTIEVDVYTGEVKTNENQLNVEFDNYEESVYELLDSEDGKTIKNILQRAIDYMEYDKTEYEVYAINGDKKINEIIQHYNITGKAFDDFKKWVSEFNESYKKQMNNYQKYVA